MGQEAAVGRADLAGKGIIVTGAAGGIGEATAHHLAACGARLVLSDLDDIRGEALALAVRERGGQASFVQCDVCAPASVAAMVERSVSDLGRLDCAVNNAGIEHPSMALVDTEEAVWHRTLAVNLTGVFLCMKSELEQMLASGGGAIVNVASAAGLGGAPGLGAYAASKHGVIGLTRTAAVEYARRGIRVNAVAPSYTATPMVERLVASAPKLEQTLKKASPMRRLAEADEVASAIGFLCSSASSFVNGHALAVDGGITAW